MFRKPCPALLILLLMGACAKQAIVGSYEGEVDTSSVAMKQFDERVTFFIDPSLDDLEVTFECGLLATLSYDWGNTVASAVRETFAMRFSDAVESPTPDADFLVGYAATHLTSEMQTTLFTVNAKTEVFLTLVVVDGNTGEDDLVTAKINRNHVIDWSLCSDAPELLDKWTPDLMRVLVRELSNHVIGQ
jgi:hypothetical protein